MTSATSVHPRAQSGTVASNIITILTKILIPMINDLNNVPLGVKYSEIVAREQNYDFPKAGSAQWV